MINTAPREARLSLAKKNANKKQWFKDRANNLKGLAFTVSNFSGEVSEYKRKKVNYDLYNNIIDQRDFEYVCKPFGAEAGELPASFTNKDIVSPRIKAVIGMEMKRPFSFKTLAVNEEATNRKEQAQFDMIKEYTVSQIMQPIQAEIEQKYQAESKGRELTPDEQKQIQQQMAEEMQAMTPPEVTKYMERKHQDPAEAMAHQLLQGISQKEDVKRKFEKGWKHACLSGEEVYWVGQVRGKPSLGVSNPIRFDYDKSPDVDFIEDGEWCVAEYRMTPSQLMTLAGDELTDTQIDTIYNGGAKGGARIYDQEWNFNAAEAKSANTISVYHYVWKDLRRIGFLTYLDGQTGEEQMTVVGESYKVNKELGDISVDWEWIPETYETWIAQNDIYFRMQPIEGQHKDLNNLFECKLCYFGAPYDNLNSETTSLMDRMKVWQYYYNIIMYRVELLMASDKGKMLLMDINAIPKSAGIDIEKWLYYAEALKIGWVNPNEEGNKGLGDVTNMAKEINMSLMSDIQKYIELADYIDNQCGKSVGITDAVIGQTQQRDAVANTQSDRAATSNILEPYFDLHNHVKRNVLQALIEQCKISYADSKDEFITYTLDDLSTQMLKIDAGLLDSSTFGIFVTNSSNAYEAVELVKQLAHAAQQNNAIKMSSVIKVVRSNGIQEAEELLATGEKEMAAEQQQNQLQAIQEQGKNDEKARQWQREVMDIEQDNELEKIQAKGAIDLQKQAMLSMGFNEDKDMDQDGIPDVQEIYRDGIDADIKMRKQALDEKKFEEDKVQNKEKNKIENKKITQANNKKKE
jgi:hypothetical protein